MVQGIKSFFSFNESTMTWIALHEEVPDFQAVLEGVSIFGHKTWTLFNDTKVFNSEMISKVIV